MMAEEEVTVVGGTVVVLFCSNMLIKKFKCRRRKRRWCALSLHMYICPENKPQTIGCNAVWQCLKHKRMLSVQRLTLPLIRTQNTENCWNICKHERLTPKTSWVKYQQPSADEATTHWLLMFSYNVCVSATSWISFENRMVRLNFDLLVVPSFL